MKRFNLGKKLREERKPPQPPEIRRKVVDGKTVTRRKWFFRLVYTGVVLSILYFLLKDILITRTKGVVKIKEVVITAPENGFFKPLCKEDEVVDGGKPLGKIYNPQVVQELENLKKTLKTLFEWKRVVQEENTNRQKVEEIRKYITLMKSRSLDIDRLKNQLKEAKELKKQLENQIHKTRERIDLLRSALNRGVVSITDLENENGKLISLEERLIRLEEKIAYLESRIKTFKKEKALYDNYPKIQPLIGQLETIDEKINGIKNRIKLLSNRLEISSISLPYRVKIQKIEATDRYVNKGDVVITAFKINEYHVEAYVSRNSIDEVVTGKKVSIILPDGSQIKGVIEETGSSYILKPHMLVGPLERRELVLPVKIKIEGVKNALHNNMPVDVVF